MMTFTNFEKQLELTSQSCLTVNDITTDVADRCTLKRQKIKTIQKLRCLTAAVAVRDAPDYMLNIPPKNGAHHPIIMFS